ncbi:LytTR family DNA-binding domain-containing protein, partial [Lactobacillus amylovorus]|uniref:LytTR family DNA-binding domain-containing protein n=1 Tax=Lactobacillus amylovorus TaxID=1604 RepID=UPI00216AF694
DFYFYKVFNLILQSAKTQIYTQSDKYIFKGRLYQIEKNLPSDFIMASRSAIINYRKLDHLKMLENGNIDAILENKIDVQISRRKIKNLKEKLGL